MSMWQRFLDRFTLYDLIIIAMLSALGVAVHPVVYPLVHILTGPLFIPSGAVAGGFYMMWLVLGAGLTGKRGTATLIGIVQALLVMGTGIIGSHGALSLLTYTMPGVFGRSGAARLRPPGLLRSLRLFSRPAGQCYRHYHGELRLLSPAPASLWR